MFSVWQRIVGRHKARATEQLLSHGTGKFKPGNRKLFSVTIKETDLVLFVFLFKRRGKRCDRNT